MRGKPLEVWFVPVSAATVATGAFVVSQVVMIIAAGGRLGFWGFALMASAVLFVVEGLAVFLVGLVVFAVASLAGGSRRRWSLVAGAVCGLAVGATTLGLVLLVRIPEFWCVAVASVSVVAGITALNAYFLRLPDRDPQPLLPPVAL